MISHRGLHDQAPGSAQVGSQLTDALPAWWPKDMEEEPLQVDAGSSVQSKRPAPEPPTSARAEMFTSPYLAQRLLLPASLRDSARGMILGQQWKVLPEAERLQYKRAKVAAEPASAEVAAEPASGESFYTLADLSPQPCTFVASSLPVTASTSDTLSSSGEAELFVMDLDRALEGMTAEESIEVMLAGDSSTDHSLDHQQQQHTFGETVGPQVRTKETVAQQGTIAESRGPPLSEYPPTGQGKPARGQESVQELFLTHVMCDYTPRDPTILPRSAWVSIERLSSQLQQHAPAEVELLGLKGVKQMITESQMNHSAFAGLPFSAWCKNLKDKRPHAHHRAQIAKFSFAYTPECGTELNWKQ